jgi:hypothetical protein
VLEYINAKLLGLYISTEYLISLIINGEVIEDYPDDFPYPSTLILVFRFQNNIAIFNTSYRIPVSCHLPASALP